MGDDERGRKLFENWWKFGHMTTYMHRRRKNSKRFKFGVCIFRGDQIKWPNFVSDNFENQSSDRIWWLRIPKCLSVSVMWLCDESNVNQLRKSEWNKFSWNTLESLCCHISIRANFRLQFVLGQKLAILFVCNLFCWIWATNSLFLLKAMSLEMAKWGSKC